MMSYDVSLYVYYNIFIMIFCDIYARQLYILCLLIMIQIHLYFIINFPLFKYNEYIL